MKIDYVIRKEARRTISITISEDGKVLVKAPLGTSEGRIRDFLVEKRSWILKHLEKSEKQEEMARSMGSLSEQDIKDLKKKAKKIIPERVSFYAEKMGVTYGRIAVRLQKSRWGSCSREGNLNFNCLLVLMPEEILDSVVVHELSHRRHMNHSKAFYDEVLKYFPDYYRCDRWLKQNGGAYFKRIEGQGERTVNR